MKVSKGHHAYLMYEDGGKLGEAGLRKVFSFSLWGTVGLKVVACGLEAWEKVLGSSLFVRIRFSTLSAWKLVLWSDMAPNKDVHDVQSYRGALKAKMQQTLGWGQRKGNIASFEESMIFPLLWIFLSQNKAENFSFLVSTLHAAARS